MIKNMDIEIKITPHELASEFCKMFSDEQAMFFKHIKEISDKWDNPFCFQVQSIIDDPSFSYEAKSIMRIFGEYSK